MVTKNKLTWPALYASVLWLMVCIFIMFPACTAKEQNVLYNPGDLELSITPDPVTVEAENVVHLSVLIINSGVKVIQPWAIDLGKDLQLLDVVPEEDEYHIGHYYPGQEEYRHGNVLIYGIPVNPGENLRLALTARIIPDMEGNFSSNMMLKLIFEQRVGDAETLENNQLHEFEEDIFNYPSVTTRLNIDSN